MTLKSHVYTTVGVLALVALASSASAQQTPAAFWYEVPSGLFLESQNGTYTSGKTDELYGATDSKLANWIARAGNISRDISPFITTADGGYKAVNDFDYVQFDPSDRAIVLGQQNEGLACSNQNTSAVEYDLLVHPQTSSDYLSAQVNKSIHLGSAKDMAAKFGIGISPKVQRLDTVCATNQASLLYAVVLSNKALKPVTAKNTIFYQLRLDVYNKFDDKTGEGISNPSAPYWFQTGETTTSDAANSYYGYDDNISSYAGNSPPAVGHFTFYNLDLLPRLKEIIAEGASAYGLDPILDHWEVSGMYFGQSAWGHVQVGSKWLFPAGPPLLVSPDPLYWYRDPIAIE